MNHPNPVPPAMELRRLYVGSQNDALYLIDAPPAPSNDRPNHEADCNALAKVYSPEVARRLATCWNACTGIPTSVLEAPGASARQWFDVWAVAENPGRIAMDGWVIQHVDGGRWRTLDTLGMPVWTDDINKALRTSLREHAVLYAMDDPDEVAVVQAPPAGGEA